MNCFATGTSDNLLLRREHFDRHTRSVMADKCCLIALCSMGEEKKAKLPLEKLEISLKMAVLANARVDVRV